MAGTKSDDCDYLREPLAAFEGWRNLPSSTEGYNHYCQVLAEALLTEHASPALEVIDRVVATEPQNPRAQLLRARALEALGRIDIAASAARESFERQPHVREAAD